MILSELQSIIILTSVAIVAFGGMFLVNAFLKKKDKKCGCAFVDETVLVKDAPCKCGKY